MRLILQALNRTLAIEFGRDQPDQPRDRESDVYSSTERAAGWDHDTRVPLGFRGVGE